MLKLSVKASVKIRAVAVSSDENNQKIDVFMNHMAEKYIWRYD